jgi:hypothetical protein
VGPESAVFAPIRLSAERTRLAVLDQPHLKEDAMRHSIRTAIITSFLAVSLAATGTVAANASTGDGAGGGGTGGAATVRPDLRAVSVGLANKLDAMLDEFPNAGVGRPRATF